MDAVIELTQAPGLSAFNRAERKMYHLSKELSGVVLPAETFGSHLNNGKTIDEGLEERNFEAAGKVLAEIWDNMVIDEHEVKAEYVAMKPTEDITDFNVSATYKSRHLFQTQYMTVALKCDDRECCSPPKTIIHKFFPGKRIPPLIPVTHTQAGPVAIPLTPDVYKQDLDFLCVFQRLTMEQVLTPKDLLDKYKNKVPYDVYFPTVQDKVESRVCKVCGKYFSLKLLLTEHKRVCKRPIKEKNASRKKSKATIVNYLLSESEEEEEEEEEEKEEV